jgi:hypothetical protein
VSRKVFRSTAAALVVLGVVVVGGCNPGVSASTVPSTDAAGVPVSLLIDTDVAPDDLVAIAFLLASHEVDIKAITVSGTGEAHCREGVDVVLRLLERLDAPTIAVACGRETAMAGDHAFPDAWRAGTTPATRPTPSPAGVTSWTPGCTSPRRPMRPGRFRTSS